MDRIIQAVIFDMDGLMFDTENLTAKLWDEIGGELGYPGVSAIMPDVMGIRVGSSDAVFRRHFGERFPYGEFIRRFRGRTDQYIEEHGVPVKPGLFKLLEYLRQNGYPMAVASSTSRRRVMRYFEKTGIIPYFKTVICGDMVEKSKPDPQIYLTAAEKTGVLPKNCMVLEDSPNGCTAAIRAGMKTVMVPDRVQPDEALRGKLFACVRTLDGVAPLLEKLPGGNAGACP
ncbi:MAG: HAD-IA family hydrolase [Oscillospiraceae bacterium]|nr:HAD-IA family hydrolase [Oscillospiraceae bacterium]